MIPVIENILSQGKRVELIPSAESKIKIVCIERHVASKVDIRPDRK